jgi:hypothetical protein
LFWKPCADQFIRIGISQLPVKLKFVSASSRCNGREATARLSKPTGWQAVLRSFLLSPPHLTMLASRGTTSYGT